jgi:threonine synthase
MAQLKQSGRFDLGPAHGAITREFDAGAATERDVAATIQRVEAEAGYLLDPHTACAIAVLDQRPRNMSCPEIVLATAHPAKFPDSMAEITGVRPALPPRLATLMSAPERMVHLPNESKALEDHISSHTRATPTSR